MSFQPWYVSQTSPALVINLNTDTAPDNITGLVAGNFAMVIREAGTDTPGTGTFAIVNANPAIVTYTFSSGDVQTAGSAQLIVKATFPTGTKVYDPVTFVITTI